MIGVCESCANELKDDLIVKCGGFCSARFCLKCSKLDSNVRTNVESNTNLFWMCNACCKVMGNARFRNAMVSSNTVNAVNLDAIKDDIRSTVLEEIRLEIRTNFKELIQAVPKTPVPTFVPSFIQTRPSLPVRNKRLREHDDEDDIESHRPVKAMCGIGSGIADLNLVAVETSEQDPEKFWLYLSGIVPDVPEQRVAELAQSKLGTTDLRVVKLVARGRDTNSLTFVSYKIGMPPEFKSIALASETWPRGIRFREFDNTSSRKQVFWRPKMTPIVSSGLCETPKTVLTNQQ